MPDLKQKSIDAIIWNLIARYGNQFFSLIIGVILARLLTPADFGLIGMITVFFAIALVFVNSGFGAAFIQKKDADETDASTIFFFNVFVSLFFYFLLWFLAPLVALFYDQEQLVNLTRVSAIVLVINAFGMMQKVKLTKEVNFKKQTIISLASTIIAGIAGISAALNNFGVWSLVLQQITSSLFNVFGLWFFYHWRPIFVFNLESLKSMFNFGSWLLFANIIKTIFDNIYILTIGKFFPVAQLGFYTKAKGYQIMVSQNPSSAISTVSFPVFSKLQNDKVALKNNMKKFMQHTLFFVAPISALFMVIAKPLFLILLTEKWLPMVPYFQLLLVSGMFFPIHLFNVQLLNAQGKSKLSFYLSLMKNTLRVLNIFFMYRFGVIYIIIGEVIISFLALFINGYYTKKNINYGMIEQLVDLSKIILISILSIILGFFLVFSISNGYLKIFIGAIGVLLCYLIVQYFWNKTFVLDISSMIKHKFSK